DGTIDARYFWKDLLALAENRIRNYSDSLQALRLNYKAFVAHLPQQDGEWVDETFFQSEEAGEDLSELVSEAFKTPQALAGYKALARIIQEEFSANDFLCHLVQRGLTLSKDPVFLWEEEKRMQAFAHGVIDIDQLCMR